MANPSYLPPFPLREHQLKALGDLHNGCVLKGGVGSGKTYVSLVYYLRKEAPKDIYVITTSRKRDELDWVDDASKMSIGREAVKGKTGALTVDSWQSISKYIDIHDAFFVFDEQRLVGSGKWVQAFLKIARRNNWIMLSATPGDGWMDYIPLFIANGFYKNRSEFIRKHVVYSSYAKYPKVERFVGTAVLARYRAKILVLMPFERHTIRNMSIVTTKYNHILMQRLRKDYWNIYEDRPIADASEFFRLMRKLVNTDPSKMEELSLLFEKHPKLIIFYNFDYELDMLREWSAATGAVTREWNGHKHQPVPTGRRWLYLVQYTAGAEAWNCVTTDTTIFFSLTYSNKVFEQAQGRIDRLNTNYVNLWYFVLKSDATIDNMIYASLMDRRDFYEHDFLRSEKFEAMESD